MMALKRVMEPSGGRILIDGVDIAAVPLFDLRSRLALVPQAYSLKHGARYAVVVEPGRRMTKAPACCSPCSHHLSSVGTIRCRHAQICVLHPHIAVR